MVELLEIMETRRSVRRYREDAVPQSVLEELMEAACWAPSAHNAQPWYFVALTKPEDMQLLWETMERVSEDIRPHLEKVFPRHPHVVGETTAFLRHLGGAPVCILAFLRKDYGDTRDFMVESTAAAIQNLLLAAHEKGLGTCWVNVATGLGYGTALQEAFAPEKGEFLSLIALGYPEHTSKAPARKPDRWVIR